MRADDHADDVPSYLRDEAPPNPGDVDEPGSPSARSSSDAAWGSPAPPGSPLQSFRPQPEASVSPAAGAPSTVAATCAPAPTPPAPPPPGVMLRPHPRAVVAAALRRPNPGLSPRRSTYWAALAENGAAAAAGKGTEAETAATPRQQPPALAATAR